MHKFGVIFLLLGVLLTAVIFAGRILTIDEQPRPADVIIILSGDHGARTEKGVELWRQGYAPYVMVSGGNIYHTTNIAELMAAHASELGVPKQSIVIEARAMSTFQNAIYSKALMEQHGFRSAIVVSSNYHMQRARLIFRKVFAGSGVQLAYCSVGDPEFAPNYWWTNNRSIMVVISEYVKLTGYALGRSL
ncbi:hypothetical protein MAMMFC1_01386 [Methylomusa anaerophila]|uniref:DUF218 domain-containing protein n=2 Tax=Methylomusa anaerophila TaxID=1930071 RepID=A0A348AI27_9FIRM|nr:hypothetical protein MAMMFC1_01386 [Methylomusa anaerophila]